VRVPFNAIVLGTEQAQHEMKRILHQQAGIGQLVRQVQGINRRDRREAHVLQQQQQQSAVTVMPVGQRVSSLLFEPSASPSQALLKTNFALSARPPLHHHQSQPDPQISIARKNSSFRDVRYLTHRLLQTSEQCGLNVRRCRETCQLVREQSRVVARILNDVLSMQQIEDGGLTLDRSACSLEHVISMAAHAARLACAEKKININIETQELTALLLQARAASAAGGTGRHPCRISPPASTPLASPSEVMLSNESLLTPSAGLSVGDLEPDALHAVLWADPYRLRQAISNLISNAVKFSRPGGAVIVGLEYSSLQLTMNSSGSPGVNEEVLSTETAHARDVLMSPQSLELGASAGPSLRPPEFPSHLLATLPVPAPALLPSAGPPLPRQLGTVTVLVRVRDEGVGIPAALLSKLFSTYVQVNPNRNQAGKGTGLGLNITKAIVSLHGGEMLVSSTEGVGSEFSFRIVGVPVLCQTAEEKEDRMGSSKGSESADENDEIDLSDDVAGAQESGLEDKWREHSSSGDSWAKNHHSIPSATAGGVAGLSTAENRARHAFIHSHHHPVSSSNSRSQSPINLTHPVPRTVGSPGDLANMLEVSESLGALTVRFHDDHPEVDSLLASFAAEEAAAGGAKPGSKVRASLRMNSASPPAPVPLDTKTSSHRHSKQHSASGSLSRSAGTHQRSRVVTVPPAIALVDATPLPLLPPTLKALVVEDSAPNRKLLMSLLTRLHFAVSGVEDGQQACDLHPPRRATLDAAAPSCHPAAPAPTSLQLAATTFDLIVTDYSMPVMDGVEACKILRARGVHSVILALTGNALQEDQDELLRAGANQVLVKPVSRKQLLDAVQKQLPRYADWCALAALHQAQAKRVLAERKAQRAAAAAARSTQIIEPLGQ